MKFIRRKSKQNVKIGRSVSSVMEPMESRLLLSTYYVSTTGSDSNSGSINSPFATIQHIVGSLQPGDIVNVEPGTYTGFIVGWDTSGTYGTISGSAGHPITIQADPAASGAVVINARDNKTQAGIDLEPGDNYVNLIGLTVDGSGGGFAEYPNRGEGIKVAGNNDSVIDCTVTQVNYGFGIIADNANNVLLEGNNVNNTHDQGNGNYGHGIYVSGTVNGAVVIGNMVYDNDYIGIHINGDVSEGGIGLVTNALIEDNLIFNNGQNGINADGLQSSTIENNLIYGYQNYGICLFMSNASAGSENNVIVNNTIVDTASASGSAIRILDGSTGNTIFNNILMGGSQGSIRISNDSLPGLHSDYNIVDNLYQSEDTGNTETLAQWRTATGQDTHSIIAPTTLTNLFINPTSDNFQLAVAAVAVDAGVSAFNSQNAPTVDLLGNARPSGANWDIGAYELQQSTPAPTLTISGASTGTAGNNYSLTLASSDPDDDSMTSWLVNWGDGSSAQNVTAGSEVLSNGKWVTTATVNHTYSTPGNYTVSATGTDSTGSHSAGNTVGVQVSSSTTTTLAVSPNPTVFGQIVGLTATVTAPSSSPSGTVTFMDGSTVLGTVAINTSTHQANLSTSSLPAGTQNITAQYNGATGYSTSASAATSVTVNAAATTTTLALSSNPIVFGQMVMLIATVTTNAPGSGTPSGTVAFYDGTTLIGTVAVNSSTSQALGFTSGLTVGNHNIKAVFQGSSGYATSTSAAAVATVNAAATTTTLTTSSNIVLAGTLIAMTATVTANAPATGSPTGTISFFDGTSLIGSVAVNSTTHTATGFVVLANPGAQNITAVYSGSGSYAGSTSAAVAETVNAAASTTTALTTSSGTILPGELIALTATVTSGGGSPTGTVSFFDGSTLIGTVAVSSGSATGFVSLQSSGTHSITAVYNGSAAYATSTSSVQNVAVGLPASTTSLVVSSASISPGQLIALTATVTSNSGSPTGTVSFFDGTTLIGTVALSSGTATGFVSLQAGGTHSLTAVYNGSGAYAGSTSAAVTETVNATASTVTALTTSSSAISPGQLIALTATVTSGGGSPTGTVSFFDGSTLIGTVAVTSGTATGFVSLQASGAHNITAVYNGTTGFATSTSSTQIVTVGLPASATSLVVSSNPISPGQLIALTATVTSGSGSPTGSVSFFDGTTLIGTVALSSGTATGFVSFQAGGTHNLTAVYNGSGILAGSTSAVLAEIVG